LECWMQGMDYSGESLIFGDRGGRIGSWGGNKSHTTFEILTRETKERGKERKARNRRESWDQARVVCCVTISDSDFSEDVYKNERTQSLCVCVCVCVCSSSVSTWVCVRKREKGRRRTRVMCEFGVPRGINHQNLGSEGGGRESTSPLIFKLSQGESFTTRISIFPHSPSYMVGSSRSGRA
jgi:hypothetical protein